MRDYHSTVLKGVQINNHILSPPPKVQVNKDNIHIPKEALLGSFRESTDSTNPYNILTTFWAVIFHHA